MVSPLADARAIQRRLFALTALARAERLGGAAVAAIAAVVTIAQMMAASHVMAAVHPEQPAGSTWHTALAVLFACAVARSCLVGVAEWSASSMAVRVTTHLRRRVTEHLVALGPAELSRHNTGALVTTVMDGVDALEAYYRRFVPQLLATMLVPTVIVLAVAWIDPPSGLLLGLTGPLILLFMWLLGALAASETRKQWNALTSLGAQFLDTLQGLPTLVLAGRGDDAARRVDESSERLRITTMSVLKVAFLSGLVLELGATLGTALVAVGVGVRMLEGWIAFQPGLAVLLLAPEFYLPFRRLGQQHHAAMEGVAAADSIFALLDMPAAAAAPAGDLPEHANDREELALSCEGVSFTYPGAAAPALIDVSLHCPPQSITAIVGPSGAGKSTLMALLLRFIEPASGHIAINGVLGRAWSAVEWRRLIAFVPQRPHFFAGSVLDNLRMAKPDATLEEVAAAAQMAEADAFIVALPNGYETPLEEGAARLSGGERQRLAIARALLKQSPVLVLDEPTSSLDAVSEEAVTRVLRAVARRHTVIVVAHRLATVRQADHIVVFHEGRIVEQGRHDALLRRHGLYTALATHSTPVEEVA